MSKGGYSTEFKAEAVKQIIDRKYSVKEVSQRLGVSAHSLYQWVKQASPPAWSTAGSRTARSSTGDFKT